MISHKWLAKFSNNILFNSARMFCTPSKDAIDLLDKIHREAPKISPKVKKVTKVGMPQFNKEAEEISESITFKHTPNKFMKYMDTGMEKFFYQRDYNKENFDFYLQVLSSQYKVQEAEGAMEKMKLLGIEPDLATYNHLLTIYAKSGNLEKAEEVFQLAKSKGLHPGRDMYNGLILAHAKRDEPIEAEKVLREMVEDEITPDVVNYTTVIQAYRRTGDYKKCWEIFETANEKLIQDEFLISFMIRICASTHQAEKAIMLWHRLQTLGFVEYAEPYNAIIFALASRPEYARQAVEKYRLMQKKRVVPDYHTFVAVLKASSQYGDIQLSIEVLDTMKNLGFEMNEYIYNGLIRTYAGA